MNDDNDEKLSQRLQSLAPPDRDPLFRIRVLELRERRQFIRRVALLLGAGLVGVVSYAIAVTVAGTNDIAHGLGLGVAALMAVAMYVPAFLRGLPGMAK
jgi:FtsH-binding integral membrane protein